MKTILQILLALSLVLWALGGFRVSEMARETPKLVLWYAVVGGVYLIFV